jgi:hypothetical protein
MTETITPPVNLLGIEPQEVLSHGPKKLLLDKYIWHSPDFGIVASYTPKARDVEDHFGIFRGVDMVEAFAQATIVSCGAFLERSKQGCTFNKLKQIFVPVFISVGQVNFHNYMEEGETFISLGQITFYKFRQMVCSGRIYKVPTGLDLDAYFSSFTDARLADYDLSSDFTLVAELNDVTGRAIKKDKL